MTSSASRSRAIVRYDSEDNAGPSGSRQTGQSSKRRKNQLNGSSDHQLDDDSIDHIVNDCIKYLLINDHKKTVIKRVDLFKTVIKRSLNRKTCDEIIERIRTELSNVFAIELAECPETANTYILINKHSSEGLTEVIDNDSINETQFFRSGLLSAVLALIFMNGESIPEELMWRFVEKLGFDVNSKNQNIPMNDDSNGITIKKLLTELWVRQLYLKYQKIPRSDPTVHEFKWGFRAEKEFNKLDVIQFVCNIFGDDSKPEYWRTQYASAMKQNPISNTVPEEEDDIQLIDEND